jgi:hypothetical protein
VKLLIFTVTLCRKGKPFKRRFGGDCIYIFEVVADKSGSADPKRMRRAFIRQPDIIS